LIIYPRWFVSFILVIFPPELMWNLKRTQKRGIFEAAQYFLPLTVGACCRSRARPPPERTRLMEETLLVSPVSLAPQVTTCVLEIISQDSTMNRKMK
ncbi:unnamed protein product, partial [Amoebophrya sp. A25]